jgi:hypothetical protein
MPLSKDPAARKRQLANLRSDGALKYGTRSEAAIQELSSAHLAELQRTYPGESDFWHKAQARRAAKIVRLGAYLEGRPSEVLNQRTGKINPAVELEESLTRAFLADLERAEARRRDNGGKCGGAPVGALAGELEASRQAWERHQTSEESEA